MSEIDLTNNLIPTGTLRASLSAGFEEVDYNGLENKPSINDVTLVGNKTTADLGLFSGNYADLTNKPDFSQLLKVSDFSTNYTIGGEADKTIDISFIVTPAGYSKVGYAGWNTGVRKVFVFEADDTNIKLFNVGTGSTSGTLTVYVLFIKTGYI